MPLNRALMDHKIGRLPATVHPYPLLYYGLLTAFVHTFMGQFSWDVCHTVHFHCADLLKIELRCTLLRAVSVM